MLTRQAVERNIEEILRAHFPTVTGGTPSASTLKNADLPAILFDLEAGDPTAGTAPGRGKGQLRTMTYRIDCVAQNRKDAYAAADLVRHVFRDWEPRYLGGGEPQGTSLYSAAVRVTVDRVTPGYAVVPTDGTVALRGPPGEPGPPGVNGLPGPRGPAGGPQGPAGPAGPQGPAGPAGRDGGRGPAGPAGRDGAPGQDGADGEDGQPGEQGPAGMKGDPGPQGNPGPQGEQGPAGMKGDKGDQGPAGGQLSPAVLREVTLAAQTDVPAAAAWGSWTDLISLTVGSGETGSVLVFAELHGTVVEDATSGADRIATEIRIVRTPDGGSDEVLVTDQEYGPRHINYNANTAYETASNLI